MDKKSIKKMVLAQTLFLFSGTLFAWSRLLPQINNFKTLYGTLFRFRDCTVPNPFVTACFFGSVAFVVALYWSTRVLQEPNHTGERKLRNFLLFCVIFAGSVLLYEFADYYKVFKTSGIPISCSPGVVPWETPCFFGLLFFLSAYLTALFTTKQLESAKD